MLTVADGLARGEGCEGRFEVQATTPQSANVLKSTPGWKVDEAP